MFNYFFIEYLLIMKDDEIDYFNFHETHNIFLRYLKKEISKEYLLDQHSKRNKLFIEWYNIHEYLLGIKN